MKKEAFNPFSLTNYFGTEFFCDREKETEVLIRSLENQVNTTLFAYRRLGKTALVKHVFNKLKSRKNTVCIYLDIFGTSSLEEFGNALATSIYNAFPPKQSIGKKIITSIQSMRPIISFDELTGIPALSFNHQLEAQKKSTIQQLFQFIDEQGVIVFIAIDEFQQILEYPEKNTDAIIRTQIQQLKNTNFIFCGSHQKMMHELFDNAKRPFFASCSNLHLESIPRDKYQVFIRKMFKKYQRTISQDSLDFICDWTLCHTFYVQYICNQLFATGLVNIELNQVKKTSAEVLKLMENGFYQYRNLLSEFQWKLLKAVSKAGRLFHPNSNDFIKGNNFGTPSSVNRALAALVEKEMVFYNLAVEKPYYETYNKFLMRWMQGK